MRTAFIVLALATVCMAAAIEKADIPVQIVDDSAPASLAIESDAAIAEISAADAPHSRAKRTLLLKKLKLAKVGLLALGAAKIAKVGIAGGLLAGGLGALGGLGGRGGSSQQSSYSSSSSSYVPQQGPSYIPPPQQQYGGGQGHSISGHTEYIVAYSSPSSSHNSW